MTARRGFLLTTLTHDSPDAGDQITILWRE
jgi:hypothetical protein